jgi:sugar O-acyltransferase (sialic acid O-acetyltransferase NeuD family)
VRVQALRRLLIVGAGGFARETAAAVAAINTVCPTWSLLGFLDDDPLRHGEMVGGVAVLGPSSAVEEHGDAAVVICTGRPDNYTSRERIARRLGLDDQRYATIVHPAAAVGEGCAIGVGSVLLAQVALTVDVTVGRHVAVMPHVVLTHEVRAEDWVTLASGVRAGGGCHIRSGAYIGAGACLREGTTVGERALIGMGSIVTRDVPPGRTWYGSPARDISAAPGAIAGESAVLRETAAR